MVEKTRQNALKMAYLSACYPKHTITDTIAVFTLPAIDINTAIWYAQDLGFLTIDETDKTKPPVVNLPDEVVFDQDVVDLQEIMFYAIQKLNKSEQDIEEFQFNQWLQGHKTHDVLVAFQELLKQGKIATYVLTDTVGAEQPSEYTFYTLPENKDKQWGQKQFKKNPITEKAKQPKPANGATTH